jgi:DNA-directed RNA polymerase I, II, and III subunit RPABC2
MDDYSDDENNSISSGYNSDESYESEEHNIKNIIGNSLIGGIKQIEEEEEEVEDDDSDDEDKIDDDDNVDFYNTNNNEGYTGGDNINNSDEENDDEDNEEDEQDDNYLQKFNSDINKNYIVDFHPECLNHNYDEISILSRVVKDKNNIIIDDLHRTVPFLTKYEKARILGQRAKQINYGANALIKIPENVIDGYVIAELELQQKKIPFIIRRPIPGGGSEYWNLKDLENISF